MLSVNVLRGETSGHKSIIQKKTKPKKKKTKKKKKKKKRRKGFSWRTKYLPKTKLTPHDRGIVKNTKKPGEKIHGNKRYKGLRVCLAVLFYLKVRKRLEGGGMGGRVDNTL